MDYLKGVLVKNRRGEIGIVTDDRRGKLAIMLGDGLNIEDDQYNWEPVKFGDSKLTCCFVELLATYDYAPDLRAKWRELELNFNRRIQDLEIDNERLFKRMEEMDGIKREVTKVLDRSID